MEYFAYIKALLTANPEIIKFQVLRETSLGNEGLFRYKIYYSDGRILEAYQKFEIISGKVIPVKYSFHLQDKEEKLICRWDNAAHYPELDNFPHHIHLSDGTVISGNSLPIEAILKKADEMFNI